MAQVALIFFILALVILLGFAASKIFQATRFPDVPLLLSLGLILGPLNGAGATRGFGSQFVQDTLNPVQLKEFAPFISSLALIIILFDSGLKLDFFAFRRSMRPAMIHTFPLFFLTVALIAGVAHYIMGMPPLVAAVMGVALSNVGQTVSAAIIREVNMDHETRSIYFIEMALYDLISIPILTGILQIPLEGGLTIDPQSFVAGLSRVIIVSLFVGVVSGLIWIRVLLRLQDYPYTYMVTLAMLLLVSSLNSFLHGSGPVSVLVFGLVIGNRKSVLRLFQKKATDIPAGETVQSFHDEITFFVRAFFFIYLGITFTIPEKGQWGIATALPGLSALNRTAALFLLAIALIVTAILVARYVVVRFISSRGHPAHRKLFAVYGRGLGTAVLATYAFTLPEYQSASAAGETNYYTALFQPWETTFVNTALLIILLTVAGTGLTVFLEERRAFLEGKKPTHGGARAAKE